MSFLAALRQRIDPLFSWQKGRANTGYDKMLLAIATWPIPFDGYLIRYPQGSMIPPHVDAVKGGRHYRLNIVLKPALSGGDFVCDRPLFSSSRIKLFRPDICTHSVTEITAGSRYVLSFGWVLSARINTSSGNNPAG